MNFDDVGNASVWYVYRYVDVLDRDVGLHSGRRELPDHTTPHLHL
jgi:hypothetical protein